MMGTHVEMKRYIPVHIIFSCLTQAQCYLLLAVYCLTGCDTCNALLGIGKKSVFKLILQSTLEFQGLNEISNGPLSKCQKLA